MGQISRNTYKKLTLLYYIARFKEGAFSSYRVQKVLYFGIQKSNIRPFLFRHTRHGQYSKDVRDNLDSLANIGLIDITELPETEDQGAKWVINPRAVDIGLPYLLTKINPELAHLLDKCVDEHGYRKTKEIDALAHDDPLLNETPFGHVLFDENLPDYIDVELSEDECEDLELSLNEEFLACMDHIVTAIEKTVFDVGKVKTVDAIL